MGIIFIEKTKTFAINTPKSTYLFRVTKSGFLEHLHYGKSISDYDLSYMKLKDNTGYTCQAPEENGETITLHHNKLEYPCSGISDYRESAISVFDENGYFACDLRYDSYKIFNGKPKIKDLPATFAKDEEAQTLEITCIDKVLNLEAKLYYTVFENLDVITRHVIVTNLGKEKLTLDRILSCCVDFHDSDMDMITLPGAWARERHINRVPLHNGKQTIDSIRGTSSHQQNPFTALTSKNATEDFGEVFGFNLVYSGNFVSTVEVNEMNMTRIVMGINPYNSSFSLVQNESFSSPEVVMAYSSNGIGEMTRTYHDLYRNHLIRGKYANEKRPLLINNWEATYFDFDDEKLLSIAKEAKNLGIEMLVMDDGWFGKRNDSDSSLGDWFVNTEKIKGGLGNLVEKINKEGVKFGIWFEPEMVSEDSELYREHPQWCVEIPNRKKSLGRNQLVLDVTRLEVRDYIFNYMSNILSNANIEYVKWDMNRHLTEAGSQALPIEKRGEFYHKYVLGVYDLMGRLVDNFPNILLENCSGGGGRFDPGMLYYSPQIWTSDDTDPIERLKTQQGTAIVYPISTMGSHVSASPNHQTGRETPILTRGHVALSGSFGYELDPHSLSQEEKDIIKTQVNMYHKYNQLVCNGDYYRLDENNQNGRFSSYCFVSKDKKEALLVYVQTKVIPNVLPVKLKLKGLLEKASYNDKENNATYSGDNLMNVGLYMPIFEGDFNSCIFHFEMCN